MKRSSPIARLSGFSTSVAIGSGLLFLTLVGCPGNLDPSLTGGGGNPGTGGSGPACDPQPIVTNNCAMSVCHGSIMAYGGLNLTWPVDPAKVVGVAPASGMGSTCTTENFLNAGSDPPSGLLVENLQANTKMCGEVMPYGYPPLSQSDVDCLKQWAAGLITTAGSH